MVRLYKLDHVKGEFVSTLMGEYPTQQKAEAAQGVFDKEKPASWMISNGVAEVRTDGSVVSIAAL